MTGLGIDDILAVHGHFDPEHPMGGRMLRPHVEDEGLIRLQD